MNHKWYCAFLGRLETRFSEHQWMRRLLGRVWERWQVESRTYTGDLWLRWDSRLHEFPLVGTLLTREDWRRGVRSHE